MNNNGLFITFEGPDGCGKSTHIRILRDRIIDKKLDVMVTREPGGTDFAEEIRQLLLSPRDEKVNYICEAYLYAASRAQHAATKIKPALEKGTIVLSDRYVDSSYAYQGFARGLGLPFVKEINAYAMQGVIPDLTFFMMLSPEEALRRKEEKCKNNNEELDRLEREGLELCKKSIMAYKEIATLEPDRIVMIDADRAKPDVFSDIVEVTNDRLVKKLGSKYKIAFDKH